MIWTVFVECHVAPFDTMRVFKTVYVTNSFQCVLCHWATAFRYIHMCRLEYIFDHSFWLVKFKWCIITCLTGSSTMLKYHNFHNVNSHLFLFSRFFPNSNILLILSHPLSHLTSFSWFFSFLIRNCLLWPLPNWHCVSSLPGFIVVCNLLLRDC